ncbi:hypothetical protein ACB098_07G135800 [Castanea mollissima]
MTRSGGVFSTWKFLGCSIMLSTKGLKLMAEDTGSASPETCNSWADVSTPKLEVRLDFTLGNMFSPEPINAPYNEPLVCNR